MTNNLRDLLLSRMKAYELEYASLTGGDVRTANEDSIESPDASVVYGRWHEANYLLGRTELGDMVVETGEALKGISTSKTIVVDHNGRDERVTAATVPFLDIAMTFFPAGSRARIGIEEAHRFLSHLLPK